MTHLRSRPRFRFSAALVLGLAASSLVAQPGETSSIVERAEPEALEPPEEDAVAEMKGALAHHLAGVRKLREGDRLAAKARAATEAEKRTALETKAKAAWNEAAKELIAAVPGRPDAVETYAALGEALRRLGRFADALRVHESALARVGDDAANLRGWLDSLQGLGRLGDAASGYSGLASADPARAAILLAALERWVEERRTTPGDVPAVELDRWSEWIALEKAERAKAASAGGGGR